jgi:hypothetical protein
VRSAYNRFYLAALRVLCGHCEDFQPGLLVWTICLGCLIGTAGCTSPAAKLQAQANQIGLQTLALSVDVFRLTAFYQPGQRPSKRLHVYLEGDGRPWLHGNWPAEDPTTQASLMLPLMALDTGAGLYLGRPCYNGHAKDAGCNSKHWTSARYGEQIVNAMAVALEQFCQRHDIQQLVLIGHSGGGTLALLLAGRLPQTQLIVTLAGNYDIDAWTDHHGYLRLTESINPARQAETGIEEWHFLGADDTTIPPQLILSALQHRLHSHVEVLPSVEHQTGWLEVWSGILKKINQK